MAMDNIDELLTAMKSAMDQNPSVEVGFRIQTWVMIMEYMKALEVSIEQLAGNQIDPEQLMSQINNDIESKIQSVESTVQSQLEVADASKILF